MEPFEQVCNKIANRLLDIVNSSDDLIEALPPAKMLDGIKTLSTALKACAEFKYRTTSELDDNEITKEILRTKEKLEFMDSKQGK